MLLMLPLSPRFLVCIERILIYLSQVLTHDLGTYLALPIYMISEKASDVIIADAKASS